MDSHLVDFTNPNANNIKSNSTQTYQQGTQGYLCPVTGLQCDDECCTSQDSCNIDNEELEYPVSADCEEVKNWDSFVEQKNSELNIDKLAESYAVMAEDVSGKLGKYLVKSCYIDGYKKAKETLYTKEQVMDAIRLARQVNYCNADYEIITSLKLK